MILTPNQRRLLRLLRRVGVLTVPLCWTKRRKCLRSLHRRGLARWSADAGGWIAVDQTSPHAIPRPQWHPEPRDVDAPRSMNP